MFNRTTTAIAMLVVGTPILIIGGLPYFFFMTVLLLAAAWEYMDMFRAAGSHPARWVVLACVAALLAERYFHFSPSLPALTVAILLLMAWHLIDYERGAEHAGMDFSVSLGTLAYLGWIGAYLLDLRQLANGGWWLMFVLPCVWLTDTGAYLLGAAYGKHRMAPRLSPKKTWEGFAAGAFTAMLSGAFFAYAYSTWGPLHLSIGMGAFFGLVIGLLTPLGDLGESMLKRQAGVKDSGSIFPGHGGIFDRIDSWLWAAVLGFFLITWFVR